MRKTFDETMKVFGVTAIATIMLMAATPAVGEDIEFSGAGTLADPSVVVGPNAPSMPNSFFPLPPAAPSDNKVSVISGTVGGHVFGGIAANSGASSTNNVVTIGGGTIGTSTTGGNVFGGWTYDDIATGNSVVITNATVRGIVFGGWVNGGTGSSSTGNSTTIGLGATVRDNLYGGYSQGQNGTISGNSVNINGGQATKNGGIIAGGYSAILVNTVSGNSVNINDGTINNSNIYGGRGQSGSLITMNTVSIAGGTINNGAIFGGQNINGSGAVSLNSVVITGGVGNATIYGGHANGGTAVTGNTVSIGGGALTGSIYGGYSNRNGAGVGNVVSITGGTVIGGIYGGYSNSGDAVSNAVSIAGGTLTGDIYGGHANGGGSGADNNVLITNGMLSGDIYGGYSNSGGSGANTVSITGGSLIGNIYGSYSNSGGAGNTLSIAGGTLIGDIFGGYSNSGGDDNTLSITGGALTGNIYGGYGNDGSATANTVTIDGSATLEAGFNLFGGYVASGGGDVFTGNTLNKNNAATVGAVRNFEFVNFGYTGNANIETLNITPTGSGQSGVVVNTAGNTVNFGGAITGAGNLFKTGAGTLILSGDENDIENGNIQVQQGTLQLGDGGATGRISTPGGFNLDLGAALAFNNSGNMAETQLITGEGKVIQRGLGTLTLDAANTFTGGTEIERGALVISNNFSLNQASGGLEKEGTRAGYVTFTGANETKNVSLANTVPDVFTLANSFRTQTGAGQNNHVDLTSSQTVMIDGVNIADDGGAFYVAGGTTMHVATNNLFLQNNYANSQANDLYVESGGTFSLEVQSNDWNNPSMAGFASGIGGGGTLRISTNGPASVVLLGDYYGQFDIGRTEVVGSAENFPIFWLARTRRESPRVFFNNADAFSISSDGNSVSAALMGDGIVKANVISVTNGAALFPSDNGDPGTLTLDAPTVNLNDFALLYMANPTSGNAQTPLVFDSYGIADSNNNLLNITGGPVNMTNGKVYFRTSDGTPFIHGDYLVIRTTDGFNGIGDDYELNARLSYINVDGFDVNADSDAPRGRYGFKFGGDPNTATGEWTYAGTNNNVWFGHNLNSLSMEWTGGGDGATRSNGEWTNGDFFYSFQASGVGRHERQFLPGDKVYVSGTNSFQIDLPETDPSDLTAMKITVSGLVVGRDAYGNDTSGGNYTFGGGGGVTAESGSAFGDYLNSGQLVPTGKLQKYGDSTLTFSNTGGNMFREGIELYGGLVRFTQVNQLGDGGKGISFNGNSTLYALSDVDLTNSIEIKSGVTGSLGAIDGAVFTYSGNLTGESTATLDKTGAGVLRLATPDYPSSFQGAVTVSSGILDVVGNYGSTSSFSVKNGATLTGAGIIGSMFGGGVVESGGTLKPNGLNGGSLTVKGNLTFNAGSNFDIDALYDNGAWSSDYVTVTDGSATINPGANLNVRIDGYWSGARRIDDSDYFTVIDASLGSAGDPLDRFDLHYTGLPRGIKLEQQGWNNRLFQLRLVADPDKGFGNVSKKRNHREIGKTLDDIVEKKDPAFEDIIERISDPDLTDEEVAKHLDKLHGDLTPSALFLALKEPWRHPFKRLSSRSSSSRFPNDNQSQPLIWGEFTGRYENVDHDGNAHGFKIERYGLAIGADIPLLPRSITGVTFQYANPHLRQETGTAKANDYEFGLYNMTRLMENLDLKAYLGYSFQRYNFSRDVSFPALPSAGYDAFFERLDGKAHGSALAASVELVRPIQWRRNIRLLPVAAGDFEKARIDGYRESVGKTSLTYADASTTRVMLRFGMDGELNFQSGLYLEPRIQYARQVNDEKSPSVNVWFSNSTATDQRKANIAGAEIGRGYWNPGLSGGWKLDDSGNKTLYVNYDAKFYKRAAVHEGMAGLMIKW